MRETPIPLLQRVIIYPHYLMASKTVSEGRRIPKDKGNRSLQRRLCCRHAAQRAGGRRPAAPARPATVVVLAPFPCAACENPTVVEILDCVVNGLKLQAEAEVRWGCR